MTEPKFAYLPCADASDLSAKLNQFVELDAGEVVPYAGGIPFGVLLSLPENDGDKCQVQYGGRVLAKLDTPAAALAPNSPLALAADSTGLLTLADGAGEGGYVVGHLAPEFLATGLLRLPAAAGLFSVDLCGPLPLHLIPE
jgi:hypothetical protein